MNGRQIILTGPDAASPSEALAWGKAAGVQEGMAMQRERLREQVEAMRADTIARASAARRYSESHAWRNKGAAFAEVLALLAEPGEQRT